MLRRRCARLYMAENRQRKWVIWGIAAILVVVVVAVLALREPAAAVRVVSITSGDLSSTITSNGRVEPISPVMARAEFPSFVAE